MNACETYDWCQVADNWPDEHSQFHASGIVGLAGYTDNSDLTGYWCWLHQDRTEGASVEVTIEGAGRGSRTIKVADVVTVLAATSTPDGLDALIRLCAATTSSADSVGERA
jgi:hypothetical protein